MPVRHLDAPPNLPRELARGGLTPLRRRGPHNGPVTVPDERLVLRAARCDPQRLRTYARVCGHPEDMRQLPPLYPHLLGFPLVMHLMARRSFPFPVLGLVHTGIEAGGERTLDAAERPDISVHIEEPQPHRRGTQFAVVTEALVDGAPVWHSRSTYLCRHHRAEETGGQAGDGRTDTPGTPRGTPQGTPQEPEGPLPVQATWELPSGLGRRYAAASGDRNPIHLHPLTARLFGFRRHIAHGMWTFARCLTEVRDPAASGPFTARASFRSPVLLPASVTFHSAPATGGGTAFEVRGGEGRDGTPRAHLIGSIGEGAPRP